MYGIKLILILIVVGGIIAYIGDKIGMKVGKRRLSLFGLRPKYTSIIITVCTGILIALISLGLLVGASWRVRQALFDMKALLEEIDTLNQKVAAKNREFEELEVKVEELSLQKETLARQINNLGHNLSLFGKGYLKSLTGDIVRRKGEVIAADVIDTSTGESRIRQQVLNLIKEVERKADESSSISRVEYSKGELEKAVSLLLEGQNRMIIRLLAGQNVFKGEELQLKFDLSRDYIVYQRGEIILTEEFETVNLSNSSLRLQQMIDKLNKKGFQDGIMADEGGKAVRISLERLYLLLNKLNEEAGKVRISVAAKEDIWRNDLLEDKIEFKVEEEL